MKVCFPNFAMKTVS